MNEVKLTFNIWVPATFLSLVLLVGLILSYNYQIKALANAHERFKVRAAKMNDGCANPDNHFADMKIGFADKAFWTCTPYFKQRTAPKVPDGKKVVRR